jgi:signal transduction histidine kinase
VTIAAVAIAALSCLGGLCAVGRGRRRLELVARAEHELRGPAAALALACERMRREPHAAHHAAALRAQLDRLEAGLSDLQRARGGRRSARGPEPVEFRSAARAALAPWQHEPGAVAFGWLGGPAPARVDRGALAKALGNLIANAAEHGEGEIRVRGRTTRAGVRIEIRNANRPARAGASDAGRGRGLQIAERAARELGGRVLVDRGQAETVAVLELPRSLDGGEGLAA